MDVDRRDAPVREHAVQAHRLTWSLRLAPSSLRRFNADPYAKAPAARWAEYRSYPRWPGWGGWLTTHAESMAAPPGRVCSSLTRCPGASQIAGMPSLFEQYSITCAPGPATTRLTSKPRYSALRLPRWSAGPRNRRTCAVCPLPEITSTQQPPGVPSGADPIASSSLPEVYNPRLPYSLRAAHFDASSPRLYGFGSNRIFTCSGGIPSLDIACFGLDISQVPRSPEKVMMAAVTTVR